jgi:hypothetical protein
MTTPAGVVSRQGGRSAGDFEGVGCGALEATLGGGALTTARPPPSTTPSAPREASGGLKPVKPRRSSATKRPRKRSKTMTRPPILEFETMTKRAGVAMPRLLETVPAWFIASRASAGGIARTKTAAVRIGKTVHARISSLLAIAPLSHEPVDALPVVLGLLSNGRLNLKTRRSGIRTSRFAPPDLHSAQGRYTRLLTMPTSAEDPCTPRTSRGWSPRSTPSHGAALLRVFSAPPKICAAPVQSESWIIAGIGTNRPRSQVRREKVPH